MRLHAPAERPAWIERTGRPSSLARRLVVVAVTALMCALCAVVAVHVLHLAGQTCTCPAAPASTTNEAPPLACGCRAAGGLLLVWVAAGALLGAAVAAVLQGLPHRRHR